MLSSPLQFRRPALIAVLVGFVLVTSVTSNPFESHSGHFNAAGPFNNHDIILGVGVVRTANTPVLIESVTINNSPELDRFEAWWGRHDEADTLSGIGVVRLDDFEDLDRTVWSTRIESSIPVLDPHSEYSLMLMVNAGGRPETLIDGITVKARSLDSVSTYTFTMHPYICIYEQGTDPDCWDFT